MLWKLQYDFIHLDFPLVKAGVLEHHLNLPLDEEEVLGHHLNLPLEEEEVLGRQVVVGGELYRGCLVAVVVCVSALLD